MSSTRQEKIATIVGFYSYKGGTGRSTALANIAVYLASKGKHIGCIDLDIEAPGLNYIFRTDLKNFEHSLVSIILENVLDYEDLVPKAIINIKEDNIVDDDFQELAKELHGELFLIPAKTPGISIKDLQYQRILQVCIAKILFLFAKEKKLDYILLDSSSGLGDAAELTHFNTNILLVFTRLDRQGIWGTYDWALDYTRHHKDMKEAPDYCIIASNVVEEDNSDLSLIINKNRDTLNSSLAFLNMDTIKFTIPEEKILMFEEKIIFFEKPNFQSDIKNSYIDLGDMLLSYKRKW